MNYIKIVPCDIANGPGVRVSLFVSGCDHHCPGCHNPQTWDPNAGQPFTEETLDKLIELLRPDYVQGLTLTGGDPLYPENRETISQIVDRVFDTYGNKKDIWVWTGYTWEELVSAMDELNGDIVFDIVAISNVIVDSPYIESKRDISLPYMGSSNQRVIDCSKSLGHKEPILWWTPENKEGE